MVHCKVLPPPSLGLLIADVLCCVCVETLMSTITLGFIFQPLGHDTEANLFRLYHNTELK